MKEYGIIEILLLRIKQMRAEDGKQEIYLEWPKLKSNIRHLIRVQQGSNVHSTPIFVLGQGAWSS